MVPKIKKITSKVFFIQIGYNSGVHAIKVGINYTLLRGVKYILILYQDTIVTSKKAVPMALDLFKKISKDVTVVHLESESKPYLFKESDHYIIFSGSIIRADIFKFHPSIKLREEFFLDQADFDLFWQIRRKRYKILSLGKKAIYHKLGKSFMKPFILPIKPKIYEPSWRYYYIVRNSTLLLIERKMSFKAYIKQILFFLIPLIFVEEFMNAFKTLRLGLLHAKLKIMNHKVITNANR
ncbi:MAG: hypothetical protein QW648_03290 [Nanoarchaeales archaeon]